MSEKKEYSVPIIADKIKDFSDNLPVKKSKYKVLKSSDVLKAAASEPPLKQLAGDLINTEESVILFARTNVGKSILAYQIGVSIAKGIDTKLSDEIILKNECEAQPVILFDYELSRGQFANRIGTDISDNLFHAQKIRGADIDGVPALIIKELEEDAVKVGAKILIIDNISAISGDLEKGENAKLFMDAVNKLVRDKNYTVIIIAHTPKIKAGVPISENDLAGSSKLSSLSDALFSIGKQDEEAAPNKIYIKQLKTRNDIKKYGANSVITGEIVKDEITGMVRFNADGLATESRALAGDINTSQEYKDKVTAWLTCLIKGSEQKAADYLGENKSTIHKRKNAFIKNYPDECRKYNSMSEELRIKELQKYRPEYIDIDALAKEEQSEMFEPVEIESNPNRI